MTHCGWLSDRIPAVVLGRAEWTPQEMQHLQECRACQREWEVVRAASRHGEDRGVRIDTDAVATSVLRRLREKPAAPLFRRKTWALGGLAAAQLEIPLPELESLQAAELDSVLQALDEPNNLRDPAAGEPELDDLDSDELERVLDTWEG